MIIITTLVQICIIGKQISIRFPIRFFGNMLFIFSLRPVTPRRINGV